jgi:hypothetical protein
MDMNPPRIVRACTALPATVPDSWFDVCAPTASSGALAIVSGSFPFQGWNRPVI